MPEGASASPAPRAQDDPPAAPAAAPAPEASPPAALPLNDVQAWIDAGIIVPTAAGFAVTNESALRTAAVYACVNLIAGGIAGLPLPIFKRDPEGAHTPAPNHPLYWLLNEEPNVLQSRTVFFEALVANLLLNGDGIAVIGRTYGGDAEFLRCVSARGVGVYPDPDYANERLIYAVPEPDGAIAVYDQDDILHIPGFGFDGQSRLRGMSVIQHAARQSIGTSLAAADYAGRFFANSARADMVIKYPKAMEPAKIRELIQFWVQRHQGTANAHKPAVLTEGADVAQLSISPEDSQLIETQQWSATDIARAFGVPPHMIGLTEKVTAWGTGIEQMSMGFVRWTLRRYFKKIEDEFNRKLFRTARFFCEFNPEALMRGDSAAEATYLRNAIGGSSGPGWMLINEARRYKNLPPLPEGDKLWAPNATPAPAPGDGGDGSPKPPAAPPDQEETDNAA